jgi:hypothetical protein
MKKCISQQMPMKSRDHEGILENLYSNLKEMDKFIDAFDLSNLDQEIMKHLTKTITSNEMRWKQYKESPNKEKIRN